MYIAEHIENHRERQYILDPKNPSILAIFILFSTWMIWIIYYYKADFMYDVTTMKFRNENSYIYYVFGISSAILLIDLFMRFVAWVGEKNVKPYVFFGTTSLFIFCFSNCLLYITTTTGLTNTQATLATLASIIASTVMSWCFDAFKKKETTLDGNKRLIKIYKYVAKGYADDLAQNMVNMLDAIKQKTVNHQRPYSR